MEPYVRSGMMDAAAAIGASARASADGAAAIESLVALAAGMTAGKVIKIAAVWCPHRKRTVLQQFHDNEGQATATRPPTDEPTATQPQTDEQTLDEHNAAWIQFGRNSNITNNTNETKVMTPQNGIRSSSEDSIRKEFLDEFNQASEQRMQIALAEHAKAIYQPQIADLQQKLREQSLAHQTENRQLATSIQQLLAEKTKTGNNNKDAKEETSINYPPEATYDPWAE